MVGAMNVLISSAMATGSSVDERGALQAASPAGDGLLAAFGCVGVQGDGQAKLGGGVTDREPSGQDEGAHAHRRSEPAGPSSRALPTTNSDRSPHEAVSEAEPAACRGGNGFGVALCSLSLRQLPGFAGREGRCCGVEGRLAGLDGGLRATIDGNGLS